jgi:hypothetical protein
MKNPLPIARRGLYSLVDDVNLRLICPTSQACRRLITTTGRIATLAVARGEARETAHV